MPKRYTDKQRLDWLFNNPDGFFRWVKFENAYYQSKKRITPRQAIDSAMRTEESAGPGGQF